MIGLASAGIGAPLDDEFFLKSSFSGIGTLDICEGLVESSRPCGQLAVDIITPLVKQADPYSFTATVRHATSLIISAPTIARSGASVTIRANLSSPAGTPQGNCLMQNHLVPVIAGRCSRRIRLGHGHAQTVHVAFVPDDGWQPASGHRVIRIV
jgi:hypothetical protein